MYRYEVMLWLPPAVSTFLFFTGWYTGSVYRPALTGTWWALGIALQLIGTLYSPAWLAGVLISVGVAIFLILRMKVR